MLDKMRASKKSEWFELDSPIGEPEEAKTYQEESYRIERVVDEDEVITWYGLGTNWTSRDSGKTWKHFGIDEAVGMIPQTQNERGEWEGGYYPESHFIWVDCEMPIYEKLYLALGKSAGECPPEEKETPSTNMVGVHLVMDAGGNPFKVMCLSNGTFWKYIDRAGRYEQITKEYFQECSERMSNL